MRYDWFGKNWYFMDQEQCLIFMCHFDLSSVEHHDTSKSQQPSNSSKCMEVISFGDKQPLDMSLDPAVGKIKFT